MEMKQPEEVVQLIILKNVLLVILDFISQEPELFKVQHDTPSVQHTLRYISKAGSRIHLHHTSWCIEVYNTLTPGIIIF